MASRQFWRFHEDARSKLISRPYISLDEPASKWAEEIIPVVQKNIPVRCTHSEDIVKAGFDSHSESLRMQEFYFNAIKEQNNK